MKIRALLFALCVCTAPLAAQTFETSPALALAFPFGKAGENITNEHALLISSVTVMPAGSILRVIYTPPKSNDDAQVREAQRQLNSERALTKTHARDAMKTENLTAQQKAVRDIVANSHWKSHTNFQLALTQMIAGDMRMVYYDLQKSQLVDELIYLPRGMLLASIGGKVVALCIEKSSDATRAGIKPKDTLLAVNGKDLNGDLLAFALANEAAKKNGQPLTLTVQTEGEAPRQATIKKRATFEGGLLDF